MTKWSPNSWRGKPISQVPAYPDQDAVAETEQKLSTYSAAGFCRRSAQAEEAAGGPWPRARRSCCRAATAPRVLPSNGADNIRDFFRVFLQMAVVLTYAGAQPVVKVGRIAGQFAKPRSSDSETKDGIYPPVLPRRHHQRDRVRRKIAHAGSGTPAHGLPSVGATLNLLRAFAQGVMPASTTCISGCSASSPTARRAERYQELASHITETINFMKAIGITSESHAALRETDFYTSHEALLLGYEEALTARRFDVGRLVRHLRPHDLDRRPHAPARTGPCRILSRNQEPARSEMRSDHDGGRPHQADRHPEPRQRGRAPDADCPLRPRRKVGDHLPQLIRAVQKEGRKVVWFVRSDAWQHDHGGGLQDPALRPDPERGRDLLRGFTGPRARIRAASISR